MSLLHVLFSKYNQGDLIEKDEAGGRSGTHGGKMQMHREFW